MRYIYFLLHKNNGRVRFLWSRSGCSQLAPPPAGGAGSVSPKGDCITSACLRQSPPLCGGLLPSLTRRLTYTLILSASLFFACNKAVYQPIVENKAQLGGITSTGLDLRNLPEARDPLVVAVYSFRDQTGQYKPTEGGSSFSTAVTQGGTSILIRALEESKWFIPIERENISDLLNERKIIRSSRQQFGNNEELPALLFAGMIIEGGIVSYDANVITGGAGVRYFGAGASSQYRQDRVTVYLRAVSVSNGKILKTIYTSRTILSQQMDAGLFRFVSFRRLLEAETGFSYNEPAEIAVTEAIEKAVQSLILEGIEDGIWQLRYPTDTEHPSIKAYKKEKADLPKADILDRKLDRSQYKWAGHAAITQLRYNGDFGFPSITSGGEIGLQYASSSYWSFGGQYGLGRLASNQGFDIGVSYLDGNITYRPTPFQRFTPLAFGGVGLITQRINTGLDLTNPKLTQFSAGGGFEWKFKPKVALFGTISHHWVGSDMIDNTKHGKYNDTYYKAQLGIRYSFGTSLGKHPRMEFMDEQEKKEKAKAAGDF